VGQFLSFHIYRNANLGNCKRRRHEAAIAEGKRALTTRGSGGAS